MAIGRVSATLLLAVVLAAGSPSAAAPQAGLASQVAHISVTMSTQSPAEAIQDAIRYDPEVAEAFRSNSTQLYLLKTITYTNGTAEDLDLPKEQLLPEGAPDRVRVADKIVYSSPNNGAVTNPEEGDRTENPNESHAEVGVHATIQLLPVPIN